MRPGFELQAVTRAFGGPPVLDGVSLAIERGENTAILGASGSGKTTILRLLAGLDAPTAGTVSLDGTMASQAGRVIVPPHRRGVSMVFQDLALWPNLSVLDNVLLGLSGSPLSRKEALARARATLALCSIGSLAGARPGRISGGEQQRVALARALAPEPGFLLLDEPFSGLDLVTKSRLLDDIGRLATRQGVTIVLVTHDPVEARALSRRAIVLEGGRVAETGSWKDVLRQPHSEILKRLRDLLAKE